MTTTSLTDPVITSQPPPTRSRSNTVPGPPTVLIASTPITAHTLNATPVARSLRASGARIIWYLTPSLAAHATHWADAVAPLPDDAHGTWTTAHARRGLTSPLIDVRRMYRRDVIGTTATHVDELLRLIRVHDVDVLVSDTLMPAAGIASEIAGIDWVTIGDGPLQWPDPDLPPFGTGLPVMHGAAGRHRNRHVRRTVNAALFRPALADLNALRRRHGLWPVSDLLTAGVSRTAHLQGCTPSFEYPRTSWPPFVTFVGALGPGPGFAPPVPASLRRENRSRPLAFVTQGTMRTDPGELIRPACRALTADGFDVLIAGMPRASGTVSDTSGTATITTIDRVDYHDALAQADVFVNNGGYTGVTLALAAGTPTVQCGATEEKPDIGARLAACGAGEAVRLTSPPMWVLRRAVGRVLSDPRRRHAQARMAQEFASHDTDALIRAAVLPLIGVA